MVISKRQPGKTQKTPLGTQKHVPEQARYYPPQEERINIASHSVGIILSVIGLYLLLSKAIHNDHKLQIIGYGIYGFSLLVLYAASTAYHSIQNSELRRKVRILDHAAIYILIAGTYTPITLIVLNDSVGLILFCIAWLLALIGISFKFFFTGQFRLLSTTLYVLMGWLIIFFLKPLAENMPKPGICWLLTGGVAYTSGAMIYGLKKIKFNHAIFHLFVLFGSICHFAAIYFYM